MTPNGGDRGPSAESLDPSVLRFFAGVPGLLSWRFAALVLLTLVLGLVSGTAMVLLLPMLEVVGLQVPGGAGKVVVDEFFVVLDKFGLEANLLTVLIINITVVGGSAALGRIQAIATEGFRQSIVWGLRQDLYESLVRADWLYLAENRSSRFNHLLLAEIERVGGAVNSLISLLTSLGRALIYTVIAVALSPLVTLVTGLFGLTMWLLLLNRTRMARKVGREVSEAYEGLFTVAEEHLSAMKLIKSHALEERQEEAFRRVNTSVASANLDVVRNQSDVSLWLQLGTVSALSLILYVALGVLGQPLATVLVLIYLFSRLLPMISGIQRNYQVLINLLPAYGRFDTALSETRAVRESFREDELGTELSHGIELKDVAFSYPSQETGLSNVDLFLPAHCTTALVGPSGAGKSTLADLVIGLVAPSEGRVCIDGVELTPSLRRAWRRRVSYVSQEDFLLHDTIRANLSLACPDADSVTMWEALDLAAADFVRALPQGLDTVVGDRGVMLSGGERQRLVLARALLRKPDLLILDEATSSLDAENEERIREAISRLSGHVTILLIAHRLSSLRSTHSIHVVDGGRIVESGSWEELLGAGQTGRFGALAWAQGISAEATTA